MEWEKTTTVITAIVGAIGAIATYLVGLRKGHAESRLMDAQTDKQEADTQRALMENAALPATYWRELVQEQARRIDSLHTHLSQVEAAYEAHRKLRNEEICNLEKRMDEYETHARSQDKVILELRNEVAGLRRGAFRLVEQIRKAGLEPAWEPPAETGGIQ